MTRTGISTSCVACVVSAFAALSFSGVAEEAGPLDALSYGPDFDRASALALLKDMKVCRDAYVRAERNRILGLKCDESVTREARRLSLPIDATEREAFCQLGEALVEAESPDRDLLWRILGHFYMDDAHDRTRSLAIRCLQLPVSATATVHGDLTIHGAMVVLGQNGTPTAHESLSECALLPLHGSRNGFLQADEGVELPEGFYERMARKAAGTVLTFLDLDQIVSYAEFILREYELAGVYDDESRHMRSLRKSVESSRRIAAGEPDPNPPPHGHRLPDPANLPPPGHIFWPYPSGRITLESAMKSQPLPPLADPQSFAETYGDESTWDPSNPPTHIVVPKESIDLYRVAWSFESPREQALQACEDLARYDSLPAEVRRWAQLRRLILLDKLGRHDELLRLGEAWLASNPNDEISLAVRWHLARRYAHRSVEELGVPWEERHAIVDSLIAPIFRQRTAYDKGTITSYFEYAAVIELIGGRVAGEQSRAAAAVARAEKWPQERWLETRREWTQHRLECFQRSRRLLEKAAGILRQYLANPQLADKWHLREDKAQDALKLIQREIGSLDGNIAAERSDLAEIDGAEEAQLAEESAGQ